MKKEYHKSSRSQSKTLPGGRSMLSKSTIERMRANRKSSVSNAIKPLSNKKLQTLIEISSEFEKDEKILSQIEYRILKKKIDFLINKNKDSVKSPLLYRLEKVKLPKNVSSSLFIYKINPELRVILSFEEDPVFNQRILTLYKVTRRSETRREFNKVCKQIYDKDFHRLINKF